jgi:cytochrome c oxidase assembly protein subunit 15
MSDHDRIAAANRILIARWLFAVAFLVALTIVVGGLTRLTDSGLSITSWKPIHGALPPLSDADWAQEFQAYRAIPEYQLVNKGMGLEEFKSIFWWEWGHRNLGRLIGLAYAIPFLFFLIAQRVERAWMPRLFALFILGGLQGLLGWYMVMSGLTERVDVSPLRLAAHLGLAFLIYGALLWTAWELRSEAKPPVSAPGRSIFISLGFVAIVFVQIVLGALVAGTDAGMTYNTWPLMDGKLIPDRLWEEAPWWRNFYEDVTSVQFHHRVGAYAVLAFGAFLWFNLRKSVFRPPADLALYAVIGQVALGIAALLAVMPIWLATLHQFGAILVWTAVLALAFALRPLKS